MTSIIQPTGSGKESQDNFVGLVNQITVETDNYDLRLHDGVTPGGYPILNRDNGDERWQQKSAELTGFSFNPEQRGWLTRQSSGNYRIRSLTFDSQQMTILNPDGYNGNPHISLNTRIETPHIFGDDIIVEGVLQVDGGINADTSGTHTGPVVGAVTGNVTGNLTGNANGSHTGTFTGNVDARGSTLQLDDEQIPPAKIAGLVDFIKLHAVPPGVILIWSGSEASIPDGWALCNGLNGTPDLLDKFIVGAGSLTYDVGDTGGSTTHTHANTMESAGNHTHDVTVAGHALTVNELPAHSHGAGTADDEFDAVFAYGSKACPTTTRSLETGASDGIHQGNTETIGGNQQHTHAGSTAAIAGAHTHVMNNIAANGLPPYYALCYIMRVII